MSTKIIDLRGAKVTPIHRCSVLVSKQEDLCSTSYFHGHVHLRARPHSGPLSYVEPAVNRQPGFRRELVEQITSLRI